MFIIINNFQYQHSIFLLNTRRRNEHLKGYHLLIADAVKIFDIVYWNLVSDTNMDDVLESGGWRTHSTCHCHCLVWRDEPPTTACHLVYFSVFFKVSAESFSLLTHDIITQVLPSSPSGHGPPGSPPPPFVRTSFGSYESWVCTANRPIRRECVDNRLDRKKE